MVVLRGREGREAGPTAAILDTQSVETTRAWRPPERGDHQSVETTEQGGPRGCDAAKRVKGRKRHIAVDTRGLPLGVAVHAADIQAADGAGDPLRRLERPYGWLGAVFADGIYDRPAVPLVCRLLGLALIIVRRIAGVAGFVALPRRWVVGRTPGWLGRWRRLSEA